MSKISRKLSQGPVMGCGRKYRMWMLFEDASFCYRYDAAFIQNMKNLPTLLLEETYTKENNNVKPTADVTSRKTNEGVLQWAYRNCSKEIHDKLKNAITNAGESKTQKEILLEVLPHRSGCFHGRQQILQLKFVEKQPQKVQEHEKRIKKLVSFILFAGPPAKPSDYHM
ncbi:hypothetical protein Cgig2_008320 [Carnegiea gigantea]|uniref:Uncharacterized protein n=1 Tax=Carnegiea gigantea TaxID=171969 RepID=A0A9Q1JU09_9CARY|nr:hypothetical protein Cgig2_008320 [Carnegiea gigantea]